jgi:hypothetical protein
MCATCELLNPPANPNEERERVMSIFARLAEALPLLGMSDADNRYATSLTNFVGIHDTLTQIVLRLGVPDAARRHLDLMTMNTIELMMLYKRYA